MDLLETYVRIAETRSISKAAEDLEVAPATVSRKLTRLEEVIGQTLVRRSTHDISLTETGERFLAEAKDLIHRWLKLEDRYQGVDRAMVGPLKVVAPVGMGQDFLTEVAIDFRKSYPGIELTWVLQNELVNFADTGCDLWLCLGDNPNKDYIKRKLAISKRSLVAAPELVKEIHLRGPASVEKLPCVALNTKEGGIIELTSETSHASITIYPEIAFSTNNFFAVHAALLQGIGFGILPDWFVQADLESGRLVEIIPEWAAPSLTLYAVTDDSRYHNQRTEAFLKKLSSRLNDVPGLRLISDQTVVSIL